MDTYVVRNSFDIDIIDNGGKCKIFQGKFLQPGFVQYNFGLCLLEKENADKFVYKFVGCPLVVDHQDVTDGNVSDVGVGNITRVWYNDLDGWYWCEGTITDNGAVDLIKRDGYSISCQYEITDWSPSDRLHNGVKFDKCILDGAPEHLAIVENPRYEGAMIAVNKKDEDGHWVTIDGEHVLIKDKRQKGKSGSEGKGDDAQKSIDKLSKQEAAKLYDKIKDDGILRGLFSEEDIKKGLEGARPGNYVSDEMVDKANKFALKLGVAEQMDCLAQFYKEVEDEYFKSKLTTKSFKDIFEKHNPHSMRTTGQLKKLADDLEKGSSKGDVIFTTPMSGTAQEIKKLDDNKWLYTYGKDNYKDIYEQKEMSTYDVADMLANHEDERGNRYYEKSSILRSSEFKDKRDAYQGDKAKAKIEGFVGERLKRISKEASKNWGVFGSTTDKEPSVKDIGSGAFSISGITVPKLGQGLHGAGHVRAQKQYLQEFHKAVLEEMQTLQNELESLGLGSDVDWDGDDALFIETWPLKKNKASNSKEQEMTLKDELSRFVANNSVGLKSVLRRFIANNKKDEDGRWVTIKGTHVFIPDGKSVDDVVKEKGWGQKGESKKGEGKENSKRTNSKSSKEQNDGGNKKGGDASVAKKGDGGLRERYKRSYDNVLGQVNDWVENRKAQLEDLKKEHPEDWKQYSYYDEKQIKEARAVQKLAEQHPNGLVLENFEPEELERIMKSWGDDSFDEQQARKDDYDKKRDDVLAQYSGEELDAAKELWRLEMGAIRKAGNYTEYWKKKKQDKYKKIFESLKGKYESGGKFKVREAKKDVDRVKRMGLSGIDEISEYLGLDPDEYMQITGETYDEPDIVEQYRDKIPDDKKILDPDNYYSSKRDSQIAWLNGEGYVKMGRANKEILDKGIALDDYDKKDFGNLKWDVDKDEWVEE